MEKIFLTDSKWIWSSKLCKQGSYTITGNNKTFAQREKGSSQILIDREMAEGVYIWKIRIDKL